MLPINPRQRIAAEPPDGRSCKRVPDLALACSSPGARRSLSVQAAGNLAGINTVVITLEPAAIQPWQSYPIDPTADSAPLGTSSRL
jgi:hypothetical protein